MTPYVVVLANQHVGTLELGPYGFTTARRCAAVASRTPATTAAYVADAVTGTVAYSEVTPA